ncbi:MAG: class I SAM-dependent methyltransferase [Firmicutes bacterium]|nr:class I SAM-dependent methyltransferase [Bacillota bacterium]
MDLLNLKLGSPTAESETNYRVQRVVELVSVYGLNKGDIVDLGCGYGIYARVLSNMADKVIGIEVEKKRLQQAINNNRDKSNIVFLLYDGVNIPLPDDSIDNLIMVEVLEHVDSDLKSILEISRILKKGGKALITVPSKYFPFETHSIYIRGKKVPSKSNFCLIPLVPWFPKGIRKKIATARVYTKYCLYSLCEQAELKIIDFKYMFMPLDKIAHSKITRSLRKFGLMLEDMPGGKFLCAHLVMIVQK